VGGAHRDGKATIAAVGKAIRAMLADVGVRQGTETRDARRRKALPRRRGRSHAPRSDGRGRARAPGPAAPQGGVFDMQKDETGVYSVPAIQE
jgi:hypothetical protein